MSNPDTASVWMFQDRQGKWCPFMNDLHRINTIESGAWIVREFRPVATEAAAMAATVPDGWKLVPEMPTKEMLVAAGVACEGRMYPASMTHGPRAQNTDRYIAMLDAAPQAPVAVQPAEPSPAESRRTELLAVITMHLAGTFHCTRVWEAWRVGTMSQDDFELVEESDTPNELLAAILTVLDQPLAPKGDSNG